MDSSFVLKKLRSLEKEYSVSKYSFAGYVLTVEPDKISGDNPLPGFRT